MAIPFQTGSEVMSNELLFFFSLCWRLAAKVSRACEVVTACGMSIASAEKIPESAVLELDTYKVNDAVQ